MPPNPSKPFQDLELSLSIQLERIRTRLNRTLPHSQGPRRPDLSEQEAFLLGTLPEIDERSEDSD